MRIIVDVFGGDNAPKAVLEGCISAYEKRKDIEFLFCGDEDIIRPVLLSCERDIKYEISHTKSEVGFDDSPTDVLKDKEDSSMAIGLKKLADGAGDAFISAGSTGALTVGATFIVGRINKIKRPALCAVLPSYSKPFLMMDVGANAECRSEQLVQFANMADVYLKNVKGMKDPKICLANIGTEENKGTACVSGAYKLLKTCDNLNFCGYIEARDIPKGECDAVICDGFTGNMLLKMYEGTAEMIFKSIRDIYSDNLFSKASFMGVRKGFSMLKSKLDYREFGGVPIMGVKKTVIKAHGSSDKTAFCSAVLQAAECVESDMIKKIENSVL